MQEADFDVVAVSTLNSPSRRATKTSRKSNGSGRPMEAGSGSPAWPQRRLETAEKAPLDPLPSHICSSHRHIYWPVAARFLYAGRCHFSAPNLTLRAMSSCDTDKIASLAFLPNAFLCAGSGGWIFPPYRAE